MPEETKQSDIIIPPEIYEVVRALVTAIRIVKLYPPNNPVYSRTLKDSHDALSRFFEKTPECYFGVEKSFLTYMNTQIGKDTEANKAIIQDMFTKGIREINFSKGLTEKELLSLFQSLALSKEDIAMKSGISTILWEKGVSKIKITEAELDGIIKAKDDKGKEGDGRRKRAEAKDPNKTMAATRTLILDDLVIDPAYFSADLLELTKKTKGDNETVEDHFMVLCREAGRKIQEEHPDESDALFEALAHSLLSLEQSCRDALIAGKLYADADSENIEKHKSETEEQLPGRLHEVLTGRFSSEWSVQYLAELLKRLLIKEITPAATPSSFALDPVSLSSNLRDLIKEMAEYTSEEREEINAMKEAGTESDILDAYLRTLIALLPLVKNPHHDVPDDNEIELFSGIVLQLEEMMGSLVKKQDFKRISLITNALNAPVDPAFKPRTLEALKKTSSKDFIVSLITDLQNYSKDSSEYISTYSYLSTMEKETTEVLLEMLAHDSTKTTPKAKATIIELLKDIGKNQIATIGEYLHDDSWLLVSSIINILSEIKSDEAVALLQNAVNNKNVKIRQEVIKGLLSIGGKKSAGILARFLKDGDEAVQLTAIRGFAEIKGIKAEDTKPLITFLQDRSLSKKDLPLTLEAIKALEKKGGSAAEEVLKTYARFQWWKSWSLQKEIKTAAMKAISEIKRRKGHG
jgi:HEAT repeat protein